MAPTELSRPHPTVWQITLNAPPDNRLSPVLLNSLSDNLDIVEAEWRKASGERDTLPPMSDSKQWGEHKGAGAVIITGIDRFFSNGLDYKNATKNPRFFEEVYDPVMYRLLTFPLVTIAAINGHAFAGGMIIALACDFRVMTNGKGMLSMNELLFGSSIPSSFEAMIRLRFPDPIHHRDTMLAKRWTQAELKSIGMLDAVVDGDKVLETAVQLGIKEGPKVGAGAWGTIKDSLYHGVIDASRSNRYVERPTTQAARFWDRVKAKL